MSPTYQERQRQIVDALRFGSRKDDPRASTIPVRSDYNHDPARCLTAVTFLPRDIARDIHRILVEPLIQIEPAHHYYSSDSMHITIKNVQAVHNPPSFTEEDVEKVHRLFAELIPRHCSLTFSLEEVVPFRTSVSLIGYTDDRLGDLIRTLDAGLEEIGLPDNKHYVSDTVFFGNVTFCRFTHPPSDAFLETIENLKYAYREKLKVETVHLITCNSACDPASRETLYSYTLHA